MTCEKDMIQILGSINTLSWNTAILTCLGIVYSCSYTEIAELSNCNRDWPANSKRFTIWLFT